MIQISVNDNAREALARFGRAVSDKRSLLAACGKRVEKELRGHFQQRQNKPNKRGWPKRNHWARIMRSTALAEVTDTAATVTISDPSISLKINGGTIRRKRGRALAIPATAEAYAAGSPREGFGDQLSVARFPNGDRVVGALVSNASSSIRFTGRAGRRKVRQTASNLGGVVQYWLVTSADIPADPEAMPSQAILNNAVGDEAGAWLARQQGKVR